jgi:putative transposase
MLTGPALMRFTDEKRYFVSEASVYRLLKAHDLITSPAFIVVKAADEFKDKTTAPNQMWQIDFTYFKIIGWGWVYLSTVLDDFSRYVIAWKLCSTMRAEDVTDTLELALAAQAATTPRWCTSPDCSATMVPVTSPPSLPNGSMPTA